MNKLISIRNIKIQVLKSSKASSCFLLPFFLPLKEGSLCCPSHLLSNYLKKNFMYVTNLTSEVRAF